MKLEWNPMWWLLLFEAQCVLVHFFACFLCVSVFRVCFVLIFSFILLCFLFF